MDNKFGKCCNCPARMDSMRQFTEYRSSGSLAQETMREQGFTSVYEYNEYLEKNGHTLAQANLKWQEKNHKCRSTEKHKFYPDTLDYHKRFDEQLKAIKPEPVVPYDNHVMLNVLSTQKRANYNTKSICSDQPLFTMAKPLDYSI